MKVRYVKEVKTTLGDSTLELLKTIFDQSTGLPPSVPATRFRCDNPKWMDELHNMGHSGFLLKPDYTKDTYRVSGYVLPLIESKHASEILTCVDMIYAYLRHYYGEHLVQPLKAGNLLRSVKAERPLILEALFYMSDVSGWWSGLSNAFPLEDDATVTVNEQVLKYDSFAIFIERVYEWNYVNQAQYPGGRTWVDELTERPESQSRRHLALDTTFDSIMRKIKDRRYIAIVLILGAVVIALGTFTDSIDKTISFGKKYFGWGNSQALTESRTTDKKPESEQKRKKSSE